MLARTIEEGVYEPGERLPSIRRLARSFHVSINTLRSAMERLVDSGFVEARERTGYFVVARPTVHEASEYVDDVVEAALCEYSCRAAPCEPSVRLDVAVTPRELVPSDLIRAATHEASLSNSPLLDDYATFDRTVELRTLLAQRALISGVTLNPDELVLAESIEGALLKLLILLNPDRRPVAVQSPTYYSYLAALRALSMPVYELPVDEDGAISVTRLEEGIHLFGVSVALVDSVVHNPTGRVLPVQTRHELADLAAGSDLTIIENDTLRDTCRHASVTSSLYSLAPSGSVYLISTFSETLVPSIKVAWIAAGRESDSMRDRWRVITCTISALQLAVLEKLLHSGHVRRRIEANRARVEEGLSACAADVCRLFPSGTRVRCPDGGYALWLTLPESVSGLELFRRARQDGIFVAPGSLFSSRRGSFENYLRIVPGIYTERSRDAVTRLAKLTGQMSRVEQVHYTLH